MKTSHILPALLAGALAFSLTACSQTEPAPDAAQSGKTASGVAVQVQAVTSDSIATENKVSGKIVAEEDASVFVTITAKCTAVYADAGDSITAGQAICTLDLSSTLSSYQAALISYQSTQQTYQNQAAVFDSQIALYEDNLSDLQQLYEIGAASQTEIDQAELNLLSARATRDSTLAQLEAGIQSYKSTVEQLAVALENVDDRGNVVAPISGVLTSVNVEKDGYATSSMPVATIDGVERLKLTVSVSEALVPKLAAGDEVDVSVSSLGSAFTGTIRSVDRSASAQTKLYTVTVDIPEDVEGLLSGMFADVTFHTDASADTIVIPSDAILTSGSETYVFTVEDGTAVRRTVAIGLTGNGVTEVLSGLSPGQQLVVVGQAYLSDGAEVRIVSGEE